VAVEPVAIEFSHDAHRIGVRAGEATIDVTTHMVHDVNCSALQWFQPLATVNAAMLGVTNRQTYSGSLLGRRWEQIDRRSAFFGEFKY
jgi:hypothetical protein